MKKLKFYLESENKVDYDLTINCLTTENEIKFKVNDDLYCIDIDNDTITKRAEDSSILIDIKNKLIRITLLRQNYSFNYPINIQEYVNKIDNYKLQYLRDNDNIVLIKCKIIN